MKNRCLNPKTPGYRHAPEALRSSAVADSFEAFYNDMGPRPPGMSLDRKDNNGNYEPDNCQWSDQRTRCLIRGYLGPEEQILTAIEVWAQDHEHFHNALILMKINCSLAQGELRKDLALLPMPVNKLNSHAVLR